jgi:hypothetical protein
LLELVVIVETRDRRQYREQQQQPAQIEPSLAIIPPRVIHDQHPSTLQLPSHAAMVPPPSQRAVQGSPSVPQRTLHVDP